MAPNTPNAVKTTATTLLYLLTPAPNLSNKARALSWTPGTGTSGWDPPREASQCRGCAVDSAAAFAAQLNCLSSREEYLAAAGELLFSLFPSEVVGRSFMDICTGVGEVFAYPARPLKGLSETAMATAGDNCLFLSYVNDQTPSIWKPRRLSDLTTDLDLRKTRTYQEAYRPLGVDRQLALLVSRPTPLSSSIWAFCRQKQDFTDNELQLSARLQPILRLLEGAYGGQSRSTPASIADGCSLTAREQHILQLLDKGLSGLAIGHLLGISPRTVAKHLEHAYAKLGVSNRIEALNRFRGKT